MRCNPYLAGAAFAGIAVVALLLTPRHRVQNASKARFVLTEKLAYRAQPALLIASQKVLEAEPTPYGNGILLLREAPVEHPELMTPASPPPLVTIEFWDTSTHRLRLLWKNRLFLQAAAHGGNRIDFDWDDNPDSALISLSWIEMTPVEEHGAIHIASAPRATVLLINYKTGNVREMNRMTGSMDKDVKAAPARKDKHAIPIGLRVRQTKTKIVEHGTEQTVHPLWLEATGMSAQPRCLLTPDADHGTLTANGSGVLYVEQDMAWFVPLLRVPKAAYLQAMRDHLLNNGRQVGLAIAMYVQDYDDTFPPADGNTGDTIMPYLKDQDVLDGFSYAFDSKTMGSLVKPGDTMIGSIAGIGGSAIIYADGHVKWRDDPSN